MEEKLKSVKEFIKENMGHDLEAHDYLHAFRVLENGKRIIEKREKQGEKLNILVIQTACMVQDFVDHKLYEDTKKQEEILITFLREHQYNEKDIEDIIYIINNISYSKGVIPESIEGKIVQDADRLDALLSIGVLRPFTYGVKHNRPMYDSEISSLSHYIEKKLKLEEMLNTKEAKEICKDKAKITYVYLAYLLDELPEDIYEKKRYAEELKEFYQKYNEILPEFLRR